MVALLYEVSADVAEGAFAVDEEDAWDYFNDIPCRRYSFTVHALPETGKAVVIQECNATFHDASTRLTKDETMFGRTAISMPEEENRPRFDVLYPLQGAMYRVSWKCLDWRSPASQRS